MATSNTKQTRTVRLPAITDINIHDFNTGIVSDYSGYIKNGIILQNPADPNSYYITQRPGFDLFADPDEIAVPVTDNRGRGIYYWAEVSNLYFVNGDIVYRGGYTAPLPATMSDGHEKVEIAELGDEIVFVDSQNNQMWYINSAGIDTLLPMNFSSYAANMSFAGSAITTDTASTTGMTAGDRFYVSGTVSNNGSYTFVSETGNPNVITVSETLQAEGSVATTIQAYNALPPNNGKALAHGIEVLDQTMYVLDTDGQIWGSAIADARDWTDATNFITAEREEDAGVYISKIRDNIVVFGRRTIEFFYNAGNANGSPLSKRSDISYNLGCADPNSVWRNGDEIYFLGIDLSGRIQPYVLGSDFNLSPISNSTIVSFLTTSKSLDGIQTIGSGLSSGSNTFYVLTVYNLIASEISPTVTYVFNTSTGTWTEWEHSQTDVNNFPLVGYTITDDSRIGEGILSGGELVHVQDDFNPVETNSLSLYVEAGYVGTGYAEGNIADSVIELIIRLPLWDAGSRDWKYCHQLRYVGEQTESSSNITIKWSDGDHTAYSAGRTIDISSDLNKLTRLGRFKSRSFELTYNGSDQLRFEGLDVDITEGTH